MVLHHLLAEMAKARPDWHWHILTNGEARDRLLDWPNTTVHVFPDAQLAGSKIRVWYELALRRLAEQVRADLVFSQTNYLPWRRLPCPTLLLVQNAGHFSPLFRRLMDLQYPRLTSRLSWRLKGNWVRTSVRRATCVTVQTQALARRITEQAGVPKERLCVIPHGIGLTQKSDRLPSPPTVGAPVRIGYITRFGVQKNFGVLFSAAGRLRQRGFKPVVVLTLDPRERENEGVHALAAKLGVSDLIENHGELGPAETTALYGSLHLFAFPSLVESFGLPMLEAMAHALPLAVAAIDSNLEVAGEAARPFPPDDDEALSQVVARLIEDPEFFRASAQASRARSDDFSWSAAGEAMVKQMEQMIRSARPVAAGTT